MGGTIFSLLLLYFLLKITDTRCKFHWQTVGIGWSNGIGCRDQDYDEKYITGYSLMDDMSIEDNVVRDQKIIDEMKIDEVNKFDEMEM